MELQLGVDFLREAFGLAVALVFCIAKPIFLKQMKNKFTWMVMTSLALQFVVATSAQALTLAERKQIKHVVLEVSLPEMPARAAEVVVKSAKADRAEVAALVVKSIVAKHRAAAPLVVAAIAKAAPEVAAAAAAAAVGEDRDQAVAVVEAAGMAAPAASAEIAAAVIQTSPAQSTAIRSAAFRGLGSVSASAFSFSTRQGPIQNVTAGLSAELKNISADALGLSVAQLEALATRIPIAYTFTGGNNVSVTIPLPLGANGKISSEDLASLFSGPDGALNITELNRLSKPKAAAPAVEIQYGTPRT